MPGGVTNRVAIDGGTSMPLHTVQLWSATTFVIAVHIGVAGNRQHVLLND